MAKLPALIAVIAKYEPRGEATVENHARKLRAGGIMTTGKRGVGAPDMVSSDATNLLFSMVARRADEVADTVTALRFAVLEGPLQSEIDFSDIIAGFSFSDRMTDNQGRILAGLFMDGLVDDLVTKRNSLAVDGVRYALQKVEILDPQTGFGKVIFVFHDHDSKVITLRFNAVSKVVTDINALPVTQIQNSVIVDGFIIMDVIRTLHMETAA